MNNLDYYKLRKLLLKILKDNDIAVKYTLDYIEKQEEVWND